jgi:probable rRNA maturation factor
MAISFTSQNIKFNLKKKTALKSWISFIIQKEKKELGEINYVFMSDEELIKTNIEFLDHHTYTDIITFDYCEGELINSDIFISIDRVKENAKTFDTTFENELHRVMIHGVLHLCGYKDKSKKDAELMRKKENSSLNKRPF